MTFFWHGSFCFSYQILKANVEARSLICWHSLQIAVIRVTLMGGGGFPFFISVFLSLFLHLTRHSSHSATSISASFYHPVYGPLLYPLSPAFPFKVSLSLPVFLLSPAVLHSCSSSEGGGQGWGREEEGGGTWALQREGEMERGKGGPFLYENAFCRECWEENPSMTKAVGPKHKPDL